MKKHSYPHQLKKRKTFRPHFILNIFISIVLIIIIYTLLPPSLKTFYQNSDKTTQTQSPPYSSLKKTALQNQTKSSTPTIVIDAGHGGADPGKVSETGTLEKDINLKIAHYLKEMLETQNINIIMTRTEDKDLATETSHRKLSDIKERVKLMENSNADIVISIHQNSYPKTEIYGAQCFYPTESEAGKTLATIIQNQIITSTNQTKIREIKPNNDYYLLKHSSIPIVIIECGFLTNPEEEKLLLSENYQREMAWAIHLGILQYLNN